MWYRFVALLAVLLAAVSTLPFLGLLPSLRGFVAALGGWVDAG
jgi:hypothetical protein